MFVTAHISGYSRYLNIEYFTIIQNRISKVKKFNKRVKLNRKKLSRKYESLE